MVDSTMIERVLNLPPPGDVRLPSGEGITWGEYAARVVEAVPADWSDVSGWLAPARYDDDRISRYVGYAYHRFDRDVRVSASPGAAGGDAADPRVLQLLDDELVAVALGDRLPGFASFHETGFAAPRRMAVAQRIAARLVRRGYVGWLSLNNGRGRERADGKPVEVEVRLSDWERWVSVASPRVLTPPSVVLRWREDLGGALEHLASVIEVCQHACLAAVPSARHPDLLEAW